MRSSFESSALGRALISVVVTCAVVVLVVLNMPDSQLRSILIGPLAPYVRATGLDQDWGVFAPPRSISLFVEARIEYADGTTSVEQIPRRPGIQAYSDYRWRKFEELLRLNANHRLWAPYTRFVANRARAQGRVPVTISLVRRWAETRPPGPGPERSSWREFTFYVVRVR